MGKMLFNLRHVPADEADDVRAMLDAAEIGYYETRPSPFGISAGGIWLKNAEDHPRARQLLDEYQRQRRDRIRAEHAEARRQGNSETFLSLLYARPLFVVCMLLGIIAVASLVLLPYFLLTR
ncbi:MAG: DUF6164 family protein [Xanthomonadaceae bacterium]|jgi:hypothetical protein|nr:DUF6164 family protein [Xanthomonadaceae bacterium]